MPSLLTPHKSWPPSSSSSTASTTTRPPRPLASRPCRTAPHTSSQPRSSHCPLYATKQHHSVMRWRAGAWAHRGSRAAATSSGVLVQRPRHSLRCVSLGCGVRALARAAGSKEQIRNARVYKAQVIAKRLDVPCRSGYGTGSDASGGCPSATVPLCRGYNYGGARPAPRMLWTNSTLAWARAFPPAFLAAPLPGTSGPAPSAAVPSAPPLAGPAVPAP